MLCASFAVTVMPVRSADITANDAARALEQLDRSLERRGDYILNRQAHIDSLCRLNNALEEPDPALILEIAVSYTAFNNDSALHYLKWGAGITPYPESLPFILRRASLMPLDGDINLAQALYDSIKVEDVPERWLPLYYESGRQMYSYMAASRSLTHENKLLLESLGLERQKKLLDVVSPQHPEYSYLAGEYAFENGDTDKARRLLTDALAHAPANSNLRARAAHHLSALARDNGDMNAYVYYLTLAATADIEAATREVAAMQELGGYLYTNNDVDRAYNYLTVALASAVECGASMRVMESSRMLPIIERAKTAQINGKERTIYIILFLLALLLAGMLVAVTLLFRKMKRLNRLQAELLATNRTREGYIGQFLNLCSIYMDKLNQLCKLTERKITTGKVDELLKLAKSGKFVEDQNKEFYEVFDSAFLHLYPDFPERVNALLQPDKQIELKESQTLTTELRILAVMRMGISDSSRIAQVLNFSINTIYAYRNRIKARAIDRDTFEATVKEL